MSSPSSRATRAVTLRTGGAGETRELAAAVAAALRPGDVIALTGDLGAGKTCFVQGVAAGLGVARPVTSPTFTIVRRYEEGEVPLVHVDVYRLDHLQDVVELGEETVLSADDVTCIEWGDTVEALLPPDRLEVELRLGERDGDRELELRGRGRWADRLVDLIPSLERWLPAAPTEG